MEVVKPDDVPVIAASMSKEMALAVNLLTAPTSNRPMWTEMFSPLDAGKCTRLGRSPTDAEVDPLDLRPSKASRLG